MATTRPQPLVVDPTSVLVPTSFMPNGKRLLVNRFAGRPQLWSVDVAEDGGSLKAGQLAPWLTSRSTDVAATVSPDGRWVAYHSDESGIWEVYVRPVRDGSGREPRASPGFEPGLGTGVVTKRTRALLSKLPKCGGANHGTSSHTHC